MILLPRRHIIQTNTLRRLRRRHRRPSRVNKPHHAFRRNTRLPQVRHSPQVTRMRILQAKYMRNIRTRTLTRHRINLRYTQMTIRILANNRLNKISRSNSNRIIISLPYHTSRHDIPIIRNTRHRRSPPPTISKINPRILLHIRSPRNQPPGTFDEPSTTTNHDDP